MNEAEFIFKLKEKFLGKVCTILSNQIAVPIKDHVQHSQYFTGMVTDIDIHGIWLKHLNINTYAFYQFPIVGIVEEQFIPEGDPRTEKIKEGLKGKQPQKASQFIPVDQLTKIASEITAGTKNPSQLPSQLRAKT